MGFFRVFYDQCIARGMVQKIYIVLMELEGKLGKLSQYILSIGKLGIVDQLPKIEVILQMLAYIVTFLQSQGKFFEIAHWKRSVYAEIDQGFGIFKGAFGLAFPEILIN